MKMRSPSAAMLWEVWRVTRVEAAWKLAFGIVGGLAVLALSATFAPAARILLYLPHIVGWLSLAALNGGKPGFPLYLQYTRPVRTAVMVGLPTAYLTAVTFAIYLVSAFLLREASGYPFSVLPAAAWIAALTVVLGTIGSSTRSVVVLMLGWLVTLFAGGGFIGARLDSFPKDVNYPLTDYALIALIGLVCFGVTVANVARQRCGDMQTALPSTPSGGLWGWLINLLRFPCPTSSATRAQVWLDLKSSGLPVLTIGVALAIVFPLVSAVSGRIDAALNADPRVSCPIKECFWARATPPLFAPLSVFAMFFLGGNAFGIRRRQGRAYMRAFEVTHAHGTAQLAALKILVRSVCVLAAIIAIGVSAWISVPLLGDAVFIQMWNVPLSSRLPAINGAIAALTWYEQLSLVVVAAVGVVICVAAVAVFGALRTRYSRRIVPPLLLLYGLVLLWLAVGVRVAPDAASQFHLDVVYGAMCWIAAAAMVFTTVYVCRSGLAEHVLTIHYASGAVAISAAFGAAWLTVLNMAGARLAGTSAMGVVWMLSPALLPLTFSMLAPWSLSRIRHT
jgi:hypothetical protein